MARLLPGKFVIGFNQIHVVNSYGFFLLFTLILWLFLLLNNLILVDENLIYSFYSGNLSHERITEIIELNKEWSWLPFVLIPPFYLIKFFIVSLCIYTGVQLFDWKLTFTKAFQSVMLSETVFLLPPLLRFFWFTIFHTNYSLSDLQTFYPLSAYSFVDIDTLEPWWIYPLQLLSVFELAYWFLLAYLLSEAMEKSLKNSLTLVASSYVVALVLFATFVVFLSVTFTT